MMADHGEPCDGQEAAYCMNGGTCYKIPSIKALTCVCNKDYKGSRCELFQINPLQSRGLNSEEAGLIAAVTIVALLILVVLAVVIYYTRKLLKAKQQSQQNNQQQYWRVTQKA